MGGQCDGLDGFVSASRSKPGRDGGAKSLNTSFDHKGCRREFRFSGPFRDLPSWASPDEPKDINSTNSFRVRPIMNASEDC
jgi:hypothetical protein